MTNDTALTATIGYVVIKVRLESGDGYMGFANHALPMTQAEYLEEVESARANTAPLTLWYTDAQGCYVFQPDLLKHSIVSFTVRSEPKLWAEDIER